MGEGTAGEPRSTSDLRGEIERRRDETGVIVRELEDRVDHATDIKHQVRSHPKVVAAVVAVPIILIAGAVVLVVLSRRRDTSLTGRIKGKGRELTDAFETLRKSGLSVQLTPPEAQENRSSRLLLRAATAAATAAAPIIARKVVEGVVQRQMATSGSDPARGA